MNENEMEMTCNEETENEEACTETGVASALGVAAAALAIGGLIGLGIKAGQALPEKVGALKDKIKDKSETRKEKRATRKALKHGNQDDSDE